MKIILVLSFLILSVLPTCAVGKWTNYKIDKGYSPKNDICSICFDKQGSLWVGTNYGVYKNKFTQLKKMDNRQAPDSRWQAIWRGIGNGFKSRADL